MRKLSLFIALSTLPLHAAEQDPTPKLPKEITGHMKQYLGALALKEGQLVFRCPSLEEVQTAVKDGNRKQTINGMEFFFIHHERSFPESFNVSFNMLNLAEELNIKYNDYFKMPEGVPSCTYTLVSDQDNSQKKYSVSFWANLSSEIKNCSVRGATQKYGGIFYLAPNPEDLIISCSLGNPTLSPDVTPEKFFYAEQFTHRSAEEQTQEDGVN